MSSLAPVLIFDSGVGGLSIFDAIRKHCPSLPLTFACDNEAFPYGPKEELELIERVEAVLTRLIQTIQPSIVVIACNTASTVALPRLRAKFSVPFVGVVPAIKPAAHLSKTRRIGLLATPGTVKRAYTHQLMREFAADCEFISVGSTALVELAEQHLRGQHIPLTSIENILAPFHVDYKQRPDVIVLACTHFPLLSDQLRQALPYEVQWIDSGDAIARRVASLSASMSAPPDSDAVQPSALVYAWMTKPEATATALLPAFAQRGLRSIQFVQVT